MEDKYEYILMLEHVKQYLATKQDDELIGACGNALWCLLSEVLNHIYPEQKPWRVDIYSYMAPRTDRIRLSAPLERLRLHFDYLDESGIEVSKARLREHLREYLTAFPTEDPPFTLSDVFEETKA